MWMKLQNVGQLYINKARMIQQVLISWFLIKIVYLTIKHSYCPHKQSQDSDLEAVVHRYLRSAFIKIQTAFPELPARQGWHVCYLVYRGLIWSIQKVSRGKTTILASLWHMEYYTQDSLVLPVNIGIFINMVFEIVRQLLRSPHWHRGRCADCKAFQNSIYHTVG